eukprot:766518-Hanusia_phi.AAC.15
MWSEREVGEEEAYEVIAMADASENFLWVHVQEVGQALADLPNAMRGAEEEGKGRENILEQRLSSA